MMILAAVLAAAQVLPVPFVPQKKDTCGAASLGMVLAYWDRAVPHDEIADALVEKDLHGIPGSRLAGFAQDRGLRAVAYEGDFEQLHGYVDKGRPLIVAWKVGKDRYHNVVVTGFDDENADVFVNDPAKGEHRRVSREKFEERWAGADHWTLLVLPEAEPYEAPPHPIATAAAPAAPQEDYDALVARGISLGKEGKTAEAAAAFDRAIALDRTRPEARVELGGLHFLERQYTAAAQNLEDALAIREDDRYARNLLASSYQLGGRPDDALREWNELGQPALGEITVTGLHHIRPGVARRELTVAPGEMLDLGDLRKSRRRLEEVGVFKKVVLRPVLREKGQADLEVALRERHAFGSLPEFVARATANAVTEKVRLTYFGLFGRAVNLGGYYRWEKARPKKSILLEWARPLWIPFNFRTIADRETQPFSVNGATTMKAEGVEVGARRVVGPRTVLQLGFKTRDREFSEVRPDTPPGVVRGLSLGLEHRFWDSYRRRLDWSISGFKADSILNSDVEYPKVTTALRYEDILSTPDGTGMEKSVIATRALAAWSGDNAPLDDLFALGIGSSDTEFPVRTFKLRQNGVLGESPMGRSLALFNIEWRQRLASYRGVQGGVVLFYDVARIERTADKLDQTVEAVGGGLRLAVFGSFLRLDYALSISGDRRHALTAGYGQVF